VASKRVEEYNCFYLYTVPASRTWGGPNHTSSGGERTTVGDDVLEPASGETTGGASHGATPVGTT
jgi:hypothetical protein